MGCGKTTIINKLLKYWNNEKINNFIYKYNKIKLLSLNQIKNVLNSNKPFELYNDYLLFNKCMNNNYNNNENDINELLGIKILFISSLITLGDKFEIDFKEFNIKNYINIGYDYNLCNRLIISLEQLYKIINNYDVIIIDEVSSFISRFLSKTNKNLIQNYYSLINLIKNSNHIILSDAFIHNDTYLFCNLLFKLNNKNCFYYKNTINKHKNKSLNLFMYNNNVKNKINDNIQMFIDNQNIYNQIENNEKILIFSDSASICDYLQKLFIKKYPNKKDYFKIITKNKYDNELIKDCNNKFNNICVMFSPKITTGIDINIKYNNIYGIYKGNSINSYSMIQQIGRCRNVNNINILCLFNQKNNNYIMNFDIFQKIYKTNINSLYHNETINKILNKNFDFIKEIYYLLYNKNFINEFNNINEFIDIIYNNKYLDFICCSQKFKSLLILSKYQGYNINIKNNNLNSNINNEIDKSFNENINDYDKMIKLKDIKLLDKYNSLENIINNSNIKHNAYYKKLNNIYNYINDIINNTKEYNKLVKSKFLFDVIYGKNILPILIENSKNNNILDIVNNSNNNLFFVIKLLNNLLIEFNLNKFDLLNKYDKDKFNKFINDNKELIDKLFISKDNNKNKKINYSFDKLLNEINNDKFNKKINIINGLYFFNQFILLIYKYINSKCISKIKCNFFINKNRYQIKFIFNQKYIDNINNLYELKIDFSKIKYKN